MCKRGEVESFFYTSSQVDPIELKEFLLHRYHSIDFLNNMDLVEFIDFIKLAKSREKEEKLYIQWCNMLPTMVKYMTFDEFMDTMTCRNVDTRPTDVIIAEIEELHRQKGGKTNGIGNI